MALNDKQRRFVDEYLIDLNATQAAVRAGYSVKTACKIGSENLSKPDIQAVIQKAMDKRASKTEITAARVLTELAKIGFADIRKAVNWRANVTAMVEDEDGSPRMAVTNEVCLIDSDKIDDETAAAISEISQTAQGGLKVKLHDKQAALVNLGRHLGIFTDKTVMELNVTAESAALSALDELVAGAAAEREDRARPRPLPN